jgi:NAD(P)-dependent dehydrogenase (short-subunit alcohol dehydrogenase family)
MNYHLDNKLCLVTGSTAGIGFAIANALAAEGAKVIINGRTDDRVAEAIKKIQAAHPKAKLVAFGGDLSTVENVNEVYERFPEIDVLVNNLGVYEPKPFEKITDADWRAIIETNFFSGVRLSRAYLPISIMLNHNWGRIIFISSESGVQIPKEMIHYGVTKTMQLALARGLAELTIGTGVTVNSVLPGPTRSEGVEQFVKDMAREQGKSAADVEKDFFANVRPSSLIQRFATNEEVANLVAYVASPLSSATNGAALRVDGGVVRSIL